MPGWRIRFLPKWKAVNSKNRTKIKARIKTPERELERRTAKAMTTKPVPRRIFVAVPREARRAKRSRQVPSPKKSSRERMRARARGMTSSR
jgi:hypothetical protein